MQSLSANGTSTAAPELNVPLLEDREIAVDWLCGHLLHFDAERRYRICDVGDESKYIAGLLSAEDAITRIASVRSCIVAADDKGNLRQPLPHPLALPAWSDPSRSRT